MAMAGTREEVRAEWRVGWPVVIACAFGISLIGIGHTALGTFIEPLEKEFGWSRSQVTSGFLVFAGIGVLARPVAGWMLDRWGSRALGIPGAILAGLAFAGFSLANGSMIQWLLLWFLMAVVFSFVIAPVWGMAIAKNFSASRGRALAGMMLGSALSAIILAPLSNHLIKLYGWREAYQIIGLSWGGIVALVCFFLLRNQRGTPHAETAAPKIELGGYGVRDGIRSASFIKIVASILISNMLNQSLAVHLMPILEWDGVPRDTAVWIFGSLGVSMVAGTLLFGLVGDRTPPKVLTAILVSLPVISCVLLLYPTDSVIIRTIAVGAFGVSAGAQMPSYTNLSTRYYGMRSFGTLSSLAGIATQIPTAVAPFIGGLLFDATGGYTVMLLAGIPILLVSSLILLSLGPIPDFKAEPAPEPDQAVAAAT
jgi:predicted MFS family arabinose efflux permease